jgi:hypothetical protein
MDEAPRWTSDAPARKEKEATPLLTSLPPPIMVSVVDDDIKLDESARRAIQAAKVKPSKTPYKTKAEKAKAATRRCGNGPSRRNVHRYIPIVLMHVEEARRRLVLEQNNISVAAPVQSGGKADASGAHSEAAIRRVQRCLSRAVPAAFKVRDREVKRKERILTVAKEIFERSKRQFTLDEIQPRRMMAPGDEEELTKVLKLLARGVSEQIILDNDIDGLVSSSENRGWDSSRVVTVPIVSAEQAQLKTPKVKIVPDRKRKKPKKEQEDQPAVVDEEVIGSDLDDDELKSILKRGQRLPRRWTRLRERKRLWQRTLAWQQHQPHLSCCLAMERSCTEPHSRDTSSAQRSRKH